MLNLVVVIAAIFVAGFRYRKRTAVVLCALHLSGVAFATFAAAIETYLDAEGVNNPYTPTAGAITVGGDRTGKRRLG